MPKLIYDGLTKDEIIALPTLHEDKFDEYKREDRENGERTRVTVSKMEVMPDGTPQITVERWVDDEWELIGFY